MTSIAIFCIFVPNSQCLIANKLILRQSFILIDVRLTHKFGQYKHLWACLMSIFASINTAVMLFHF